MSKELRKELELKAKEFKFEADTTKKKARELYKIALKALDKVDYLQNQLDAYKAPTLYDKTEAHKIPERTYLSRAERISEFLAKDPDGEPFRLFLQFNRLTIEEAKEIVYKASQTK